MSFLTMPPEINSLRMYSGAGAAPMLEAAAAWAALATELNTAASAFGAVTSGLAEQAWQGPAAQAMAAAAAPYAAYLSTAGAHADNAALQARSVADVFEAARAAVVHPLAIEANRNGFVRLVMSNFFGQNAPAIAAAESVYEEMWAADVDAMVGYHAGASAAAEEMVTFGPIRLPRGTFVKPFVQAMKRLAKTTNKLRKNTEKLRDIAEREISEEMQQRQAELNALKEKFRYPGYSNPFGSWGR